MRLAERVARHFQAAFLNVGDIILYGKYKNKKGRIVRFTTNEKGQPQVEIEPIPKGRKKNKVMGLFKIWSQRAKEEAQAKKEMEEKGEVSEPNPPKTGAEMIDLNRIVSRFVLARSIPLGETVENGMVRIHRYRDHYRVTDLTNAGKRGKKVRVMTLSPSYSYQGKPDQWMDSMSKALGDYRTYDQVKSFIADLLADFPGEINVDESQERGVDVTPAGFQPLRIEGRGVVVEVGYKNFSVRNVADQFNLPTCIPAIQGGLKSIPVFYRWVKDNEAAIKRMTFPEVVKEMGRLGVKFHQYCAID